MGRTRDPETSAEDRTPKPCAVCGREMTWRRRWAANWAEVRYCSDACRRRRDEAGERRMDDALMDLARRRGRHATFCPSELARQLAPEDWRPLMEPVREAARRLHAAGRLEILQGGHPVDPSRARGPIRLRWTGTLP